MIDQKIAEFGSREFRKHLDLKMNGSLNRVKIGWFSTFPTQEFPEEATQWS